MGGFKGGEYNGLVYTIAYPKTNNLKIPQGKRMNAKVEAFSCIVKGFDKLGMKALTKRMIAPLELKITEGVNNRKVVLVVLQLIQWDRKNGAGHLDQRLHYAYIGAIADSRHLAFNIHNHRQNQPLLQPAPAPGWVNGQQIYLWFENKEKQKEQNKSNLGNLHWEVAK